MVNVKDSRLSKFLLITAISAAAFSIALGMVVLVGWHTDNRTLIQVLPLFVPMQYNTALGFLLCGTGMILATFNNRYITLAISMLIICLGSLTLLEYTPGWNLGIDELFMEHGITVKTSHPGRMAPNTATCFTLIGSVLAFSFFSRKLVYQSQYKLVLASLSLGFSVVALSGYMTHLESAYGWSNLTRMAVHTSVGFIVLSIGLLISIWQHDIDNKNVIPSWLPITIAIGSLTITTCLWQVLHHGHNLTANGSDVTKVHSSISITVLIIGIVFSIALSLSVYFALVSSRRARKIGEMNKELASEIFERKRIADELRKHQDHLEHLVEKRTTALTDLNMKLKVEIAEREQSEERTGSLANILEESLNEIYIFDAKTLRFIQVNKGARLNLGYSMEELLVMTPVDLKPTFTAETFAKAIEPLLAGVKQTIQFTTIHQKKDGSLYDVEVHLQLSTFQSVLVFVAIILDITKRKAVEDALRESEERSLLLLNSTGEAIYGIDLEGNCTFCNPSCLRLLGYEDESQLLGRNMHDMIHHTRRDGTPYPVEECCIYQAFREGKGTHVDDEVFWRADGTSFAAEYRSFPTFQEGEAVGSVVSFVDITERKQVEGEIIRKSKLIELQQSITSTANDTENVEDALKLCMNKICSFMGWPVGHIYMPDTIGKLIPTSIWYMSDHERFKDFQKITSKTFFRPGEGLPGRTLPSGKPQWIADLTKDPSFFRAQHAKEAGIKSAFAFPILERENVVAVLEFFSENVVEADKLMMNNLSFLAIQLGRVIERMKAEAGLKALNESLEITVADRTLKLVKSNEMLKQEIDERKRNEKEREAIQIKMMAASKLASLGEIATGIAHEINQPLTYISSFIQRFRHKLENNDIDGDELKQELKVSSAQISRIDNIIAHLRTFGRNDSALTQLVRIEKILDNTLLLMRERIRLNNIELSLDIEPDLPEIKGSPTGLEQVFINLFQNSMDAFPEKHKGAEIRIGVHLSEDRKLIIIKYSDNGIGIEKKMADKIFEPFFTTKEVGKGTGLGLSIVYGIIKDHNGWIECESEINKGTLFTIKLPLNNEEPQ